MPNPAVHVIVSLAPSGGLQLELPGSAGGSRAILLKWTSAVDPSRTIERVLNSLAQGQSAIGLDGAPTRQQLQHWEKHWQFADSRCPFCLAEQELAKAFSGEKKHRSHSTFDARYATRRLGETQVRVIPLGESAAKAKARGAAPPPAIKKSKKSARELGF